MYAILRCSRIKVITSWLARSQLTECGDATQKKNMDRALEMPQIMLKSTKTSSITVSSERDLALTCA